MMDKLSKVHQTSKLTQHFGKYSDVSLIRPPMVLVESGLNILCFGTKQISRMVLILNDLHSGNIL